MTDHETVSATLSELWSPRDAPVKPSRDVGACLVDAGIIDESTLADAVAVIEQSPGMTLVEALATLGVDEPAMQEVIARAADLPFLRIGGEQGVRLDDLQKLSLDFCESAGVMPLHRIDDGRVLLGVIDPDRLIVVDEVRHKLASPIKLAVICRADHAAVIEQLRETESGDEEIDQIIAGIEEDDVEIVESQEEQVDLERMAGESPVIRLVNYLIFNAVKEAASDIHIEPQERRLQVRYRIDGVLFEMMTPPMSMHAAIISRLKIMANLDIAERRLPQDGRIRAMVHGRKLDLRLSTLPTAHGEKAVLRILDTRSIHVTLDELGMDENTLTLWKHQIDQPHGILLVTGPTGSGKSTTLYSSIRQMDRAKLNISTVEDPVEFQLEGICQTQVHEKIGMSFNMALRALLRQDPDVIMLGEIRDAQTGQTAIQASLTGHLVLSTLHTNDAPSSVTRLINIGVEPFLVGAALNGTLAQRLVRRICPHCRQKAQPPVQIAEQHGINEVWQGVGCDKCRDTGYSGRIGLYEILVLDDFLRDRIVGKPNVTEFRRLCVERGMATLRDDGFRKVAAGLTTVDEVLRVTEAAA